MLLDKPARVMPPPRGHAPTRDGRRLPLVLAALLHVLFVLAIWHEMQAPPIATVVHVRLDDMLQVRFIESAPTVAVQPPPALSPPPAPRPPAVPRREPPAKDAMTVQLPTPAPADTARLYDQNGQPRLPAAAASAPEPGYVQRMPPGDMRVMQHADPVKYKATRFEQYFPPPDETAGGSVVRHVVEAVVKSTEVNLPGGVHLQCTTVVGIPTPSCKMPPARPSAKDGDERLSMAPAKPLATGPQLPTPPSEAACISMYRAGMPLAYGCPVDTPNRSVDAELRERAAGAARHP
jgi:hypothetical protein